MTKKIDLQQYEIMPEINLSNGHKVKSDYKFNYEMLNTQRQFIEKTQRTRLGAGKTKLR